MSTGKLRPQRLEAVCDYVLTTKLRESGNVRCPPWIMAGGARLHRGTADLPQGAGGHERARSGVRLTSMRAASRRCTWWQCTASTTFAACLQLMAAVQEFCLDQGIAKVSAIMETWWLPRFHEAGFVVTPRPAGSGRERMDHGGGHRDSPGDLDALHRRIGTASVCSRTALVSMPSPVPTTGLTTLAYLFRMAALEASTASSLLAEPDEVSRQMTSH